MKKLSLLSMLALFAAILIFSTCKKENVKYGNKRIVGTWVLVKEASEYTYNSSSSYTYPTNPCWTSYSSSSTGSGSYEVTESSVTESETWSDTYDGETTSESSDTTYTITRKTEITFNEDGTCTILDDWQMLDPDGNPDDEYTEMTGYWNWLDAYEEKVGINIVFSGGDQKNKAIEPAYSSEMHLYIETLDKDFLSFTFSSSSVNESEYSYYNYCGVDQTDYLVNYTYSGSSVETGTRELEKQEPEK